MCVGGGRGGGARSRASECARAGKTIKNDAGQQGHPLGSYNGAYAAAERSACTGGCTQRTVCAQQRHVPCGARLSVGEAHRARRIRLAGKSLRAWQAVHPEPVHADCGWGKRVGGGVGGGCVGEGVGGGAGVRGEAGRRRNVETAMEAKNSRRLDLPAHIGSIRHSMRWQRAPSATRAGRTRVQPLAGGPCQAGTGLTGQVDARRQAGAGLQVTLGDELEPGAAGGLEGLGGAGEGRGQGRRA